MQNDSPHKSKATELERIVEGWERRHERRYFALRSWPLGARPGNASWHIHLL